MKYKYFLLIGLFFVISCGGLNEEDVVGHWQLQKVNTNQQVTNHEDYSKAMNQLIRTTSIYFNENNTFTGTIWGDTTFGFWTIKGDSLRVEDESNKVVFMAFIQDISYNNLVLKEQTDSIIEILTFTRVDL